MYRINVLREICFLLLYNLFLLLVIWSRKVDLLFKLVKRSSCDDMIIKALCWLRSGESVEEGPFRSVAIVLWHGSKQNQVWSWLNLVCLFATIKEKVFANKILLLKWSTLGKANVQQWAAKGWYDAYYFYYYYYWLLKSEMSVIYRRPPWPSS